MAYHFGDLTRGIAGFSGSLINDITGVTQQQQFNSAEALKQRNWEQEMSSTAYQRAVSDMQAAGLNPALMYGQGGAGAAATPSGSSASSNIAQPNHIAGIISSAASLINAGSNAGLNKAKLAQIASSAHKIIKGFK